jgi:hypothetical protein
MPVPPAELSAHFVVSGPDGAHEAARAAAASTGIAHDAGPGETLLSGSRADVIAALEAVVAAALDAHAHRLEVRLEAPTESRP